MRTSDTANRMDSEIPLKTESNHGISNDHKGSDNNVQFKSMEKIFTPSRTSSKQVERERLSLSIPLRSDDHGGMKSPLEGALSPIAPMDIGKFIKSHSLFSNASEDFITDLVRKMHFRNYPPGDLIVREGEIGKAMFLIIKGFVTVSSKDGESIFADLGPGNFFGEIGVLFEVPRTANVVAKTKCFIAALRINEMNEIMQHYPEIADEIRIEADDRYQVLLKKGKVSQSPIFSFTTVKVPEFQLCTSEAYEWIILRADQRHFKKGHQIIKKHDVNYDLFVLKSGVVRIEVDTEKTFEILDKKGMFFGEVAAVEKVPRLENVYADTDVDLYALNSALFFGFLKKFPLMGERTKRASNRVQNFIRLKEAKQHKKQHTPQPSSTIPSPLSAILTPDTQEGNGPNDQFSGPQRRSTLPVYPTAVDIPRNSDHPVERTFTFPLIEPNSIMLSPKSGSSSNFYLQSAAPLVTSASRSISVLSSKQPLEGLKTGSSSSIGMSFDSLLGQYSPTRGSLEMKAEKTRSTSSLSTVGSENHNETKSSKGSKDRVETASSKASSIALADNSRQTPELTIKEHMPESPEIDTMEDQHENAEDDAFSDEYETEDSENSQESATSEDMEMEIEDVALPMRKPVNTFSKAIIQSMKNDPKKRRASIAVWADSKLSELASQNASKSFKVSETPTTAPSRFQVIATTSISKDFSSEELLTNGPEDCLMNPRILERIFSYLSFKTLWIIRRVNTVWHRTIQSSADLIRFVDLSEEHGKTVDDKVLGNIALFLGSNVEVLILKNCWKLTSAGLRELAAYNPNIQVLDLSGCWDITDAGLNSLSLGCRRIKCLDLSNCRKVTDSGLYNLLATSQNLLDIHLSYCKALSDTSLASISTMCTNIRRLNLQRCLGITDVGYATFGTMLHNKLHELQISDCSFLTDSAMKHISESCPNLKVLNISFCCALSEVSIQYLTHGCPKMKAFDASFCGNAISDETISIIATNWKDLEKLSVRGCVRIGNAAVQYLVDNCRSLKTLNISSCKNVSDNILAQIPKEWTLLSAQTPLIESSGIGNGDVTGSSHIRRFTAP